MPRVLFLPDPRRKYRRRQVDNVRRPLTRDTAVARFCELARMHHKAMNEGDLAEQHGHLRITGEAARRLHLIDFERQQLQRETRPADMASGDRSASPSRRPTYFGTGRSHRRTPPQVSFRSPWSGGAADRSHPNPAGGARGTRGKNGKQLLRCVPSLIKSLTEKLKRKRLKSTNSPRLCSVSGLLRGGALQSVSVKLQLQRKLRRGDLLFETFQGQLHPAFRHEDRSSDECGVKIRP